MADTLITGTTLVEKESRSIGDIPISGIIEWDDSIPGTPNIPEGFLECDGSTVIDALSPINGQTIPNLNTDYLSLGGPDFKTNNPDVNDINHTIGHMTLTGAGLSYLAPVNLPNGVTITGAVVYSNVATENWALESRDISGDGNSITHAAATLNTEDTTITSGVIDNSAKKYFFRNTDVMDASDVIYGARITYTPRNKFIIRIR